MVLSTGWFLSLITEDGVAHTLLLYSFVILLGSLLARVKIKGVSLGVAWVLFAGFFVGYFRLPVNADVLDFVKNFGLVMFIFGVGLEAGPHFFSSLRSGGVMYLRMTLLAVLTGTALAVIFAFVMPGITDVPSMSGLLAGATNSTPAMGASQETLNQLYAARGETGVPDLSVPYAVAYPAGIIGCIVAVIVLRKVFKVNTKEAEEAYLGKRRAGEEPVAFCVRVTNPALEGVSVVDAHSRTDSEFVISRIRKGGELITPRGQTVLCLGESLLCYAKAGDIPKVTAFFGESLGGNDDLAQADSRAHIVLVSDDTVNGKTISALNLRYLYGVSIVSVRRGDQKLSASPDLALMVGDRVVITGPEKGVDSVTHILGNKSKKLETPRIFTIFLGIFLGIILGVVPIKFPGLPLPMKLGLAGGPLIVALLMSAFGHKIGIITYTTQSATQMMKQIGLCLFLASVGIASGPRFVEAAFSWTGLLWFGLALVVGFVPSILMGVVAMKKGINFFTASGMISGTYTSAPVLGFVNTMTECDAPSLGYSLVYPMTLFLRILIAQFVVLL